MRRMEHSTASQPLASEARDTTETSTTKKVKAHGDRNFESLILPGLVSVPPMPEWLRKLFRRKDTPAAS